MRLKDAPFHTLLACIEGMGDEVRHTFYVRHEGDAGHANFLPTYGIATVQGCPWRGAAL